MGSEILGLARYGLDPRRTEYLSIRLGWIPYPGERFESFGGKGDIYIPVPVIGGGERWWCRWSGHSWVALSDRRFEF